MYLLSLRSPRSPAISHRRSRRTLDFSSTYARLLEELGRPPHAFTSLRASFVARTGEYGVEDPWFDARQRAFLDDAITHASVLGNVELGDALLVNLASACQRAMRGVFEVHRSGDTYMFRDAWTLASFYIVPGDQELARALSVTEQAMVDARLLNWQNRIVVLPGAFFHPEEATPSLSNLIAFAREDGRDREACLDAFMRMERSFRVSSRVKAAHVYRRDVFTRKAGNSPTRGFKNLRGGSSQGGAT